MRYLITTTALLALIMSPLAIAQTGNQPSTTADKRVVPPAPVGHRQPRAADIPPGATAAEKQSDAEDAALDRKIKSICRGC